MIDLEQRVEVLEKYSKTTNETLIKMLDVMQTTRNMLKETYTQVMSNQKSIAENQKSIAELMDITHNNYDRTEEVKVIAEGNAAGIARLNERYGES